MADVVRCECGSRVTAYSDKRDAYFCEKCDQWLEGICTSENCEYCPGRPLKPSEDEEQEHV